MICNTVTQWFNSLYNVYCAHAFSALTLLVGGQAGHPACKRTEWWSADVVICMERGANLHMAQLMPLPLTVSCCSKIQIGITFLVLAHPGSPGQRAIKGVCVFVCVIFSQLWINITIIWDNLCYPAPPVINFKDFVGTKCYCLHAVVDSG